MVQSQVNFQQLTNKLSDYSGMPGAVDKKMEILKLMLDAGVEFEVESVSSGCPLQKCVTCAKLFFKVNTDKHSYKCGCVTCIPCLRKAVYRECGKTEKDILKA